MFRSFKIQKKKKRLGLRVNPGCLCCAACKGDEEYEGRLVARHAACLNHGWLRGANKITGGGGSMGGQSQHRHSRGQLAQRFVSAEKAMVPAA